MKRRTALCEPLPGPWIKRCCYVEGCLYECARRTLLQLAKIRARTRRRTRHVGRVCVRDGTARIHLGSDPADRANQDPLGLAPSMNAAFRRGRRSVRQPTPFRSGIVPERPPERRRRRNLPFRKGGKVPLTIPACACVHSKTHNYARTKNIILPFHFSGFLNGMKILSIIHTLKAFWRI